MKYLVSIAAILLLIVVLKMQGCGVLDGMRERKEQRQEQRQERKEKRQDRKERNPDKINPDKKKRFGDHNGRFFRDRRDK